MDVKSGNGFMLIGQHVITLANDDKALTGLMTSLGHNEWNFHTCAPLKQLYKL